MIICYNSNSYQTAVMCGCIFLSPFFAFSSATLQMKHTNEFFHWLFHANFVENAIKGTLMTIYGLNRTKMECDITYCHYTYPSKLLEEVGAANIERVFAVLIAYAIVSRLITYLFLKYRLKH